MINVRIINVVSWDNVKYESFQAVRAGICLDHICSAINSRLIW